MRVLEIKPAPRQTMGKKKHKLRKQSSKNQDVENTDSSDEASTEMGGPGCPHLNKSIQFNTVKKALKQLGSVGHCLECSKDGGQPSQQEAQDGADTSSPTGDEALFDVAEPTIWVCLQCGHQGCDRNSRHKHALKHYQTPRSSSHAVVVNVNTWSVWCYDCDDELAVDSSKQLQECISYLRKQTGMPQPPLPQTMGRRVLDSVKEAARPQQQGVPDMVPAAKDDKTNLQNKAKVAISTAVIPQQKVKGLSNLGNTCFFNAVMQNLSQTPGLESIISEQRGQQGVTINVPAPDDSESDDPASGNSGDEEEKLKLEPLPISRADSGALTESVLSFLSDMHSASKNSTISPSSLFGQVCRKAPRFKGFQQQDSHELLRHLLDGMKAEEIRRSQVGILKAFHLPENVNAKRVDEITRSKVKGYGRHVKHTFVDSIFGGHFISTVLCEECKTPSQIFEPFLDISLPITEEKPTRPNILSMRKRDSKSFESKEEEPAASRDDRLSKHQLKKSKRQAKREAKKKPKGKEDPDTDKAEVINGERDQEEVSDNKNSGRGEDGKESSKSGPGTDSPSNNDEWDSKSDADIEDNIESDVSRTKVPALETEEGKDHSLIPQTDGALQDGGENMVLPNQGKGSCDQRTNQSNGLTHSAGHIPKTVGSNKGGAGVKEVTDSLKSMSLNHMDTINQNGDNCDDNTIGQSKSEEDRHTTSPTSLKPGKSRSELNLEAQIRAMGTLVPRYQPVARECSLRSCLNQFTAPELLTGNNKFGCEKCTCKKYGRQPKEGKKETVYTNASKQVLIFSPPAVLTMHLKRFQQVGFSLRKVNRQVEFPLILDLAPFCSALAQGVKPNQTKVLYSLYGVVEHSGRLTGGHYTAYVKVRPNSSLYKDFLHHQDLNGLKIRKVLELLQGQGQEGLGETEILEAKEGEAQSQSAPNPPAGKWYYISDSRVSETTECSVLKCQAYLLFYERIH